MAATAGHISLGAEMNRTNLATDVPPRTASALTERMRAIPLRPARSGQEIPRLRVIPLRPDLQKRRFARVPTHAVGVHPEHREYPRATLKLPLKLRSVDSVREEFPITLVTRNISPTGVYFLCPKQIAVGATIELEVVLVSRPLGRGNVVMVSVARVLRSEPAATPGWHGIAASYDEMEFDRDDRIPSRFLSAHP